MKIHHGGRIGDLLFALHTIKKLSDYRGPVDLYLSNYHRVGWSIELAKSLRSLLVSQSYINSVHLIDLKLKDYPLDYQEVTDILVSLGFNFDESLSHSPDRDMVREVEAVFNPKLFPEWNNKEAWPGNINICKRYYRTMIGSDSYHEYTSWIESLDTPRKNLGLHFTKRRWTRDLKDITKILSLLDTHKDHDIYLFVSQQDLLDLGCYEMCPLRNIKVIKDEDFYQIALYLSECKFFYGNVSSINALAQGIGIPTYVDIADGCHNTFHSFETTHMKPKELVDIIIEKLYNS